MSRNGVCHERGSVHYQQTIYFEAFDSIETCVAAGGRQMGGEFEDNAPQLTYRGSHPPRYFVPYIVMGVVVATVLFAAVILPMWRRRQSGRSLRSFEDRERRLWKGHKLEPKNRPRR